MPGQINRKNIKWEVYGPVATVLYEAWMPSADMERVIGLKRTAIKGFLKKNGLLRTQSQAAWIAGKLGRKGGLEKLIESAKTFNRFNPAKGRPGSSHPKWITDRTKVKFRPRYELRNWREAVFKRDDFTCQWCGQRGGRLQADHIKPYCLFPELRWNVDNGRTLCETCHKKTPTYGIKALKYVTIP